MSEYVTVKEWADENKQLRGENKKDRHELANRVQEMFLDVSDKMDLIIEKMSDLNVLKVEVENIKAVNVKQEMEIENLKSFMYKITAAISVISFFAPQIADKLIK